MKNQTKTIRYKWECERDVCAVQYFNNERDALDLQREHYEAWQHIASVVKEEE